MNRMYVTPSHAMNNAVCATILQEHGAGKSLASAAALSTVLRTTTLSYGNMRFSGTRSAETPQPIKTKFPTIDKVGKLTRCTKNGCNRLAGGGPTDRWNITSKTFLTIPYLTILYLTFFYSCMPLQPKRQNRFARTIAQTTRFAVRKYLFGVALIQY